ncbi:hypothetical protein [Flavihumibacter petaseus]|uniref:Uncharacterized protein n=1 Tax=Flavihumibacter petaseus NBRC 106054 TaxID=1220578 RepID=A0A0E9MZR9_9BACT|nr:hypothetical protein [Flavihumibacter petaseus]GAO43064.1 hypothetical protein FPE01S_02_01690 [Flavihumibacter petaseus NBRC 106054]
MISYEVPKLLTVDQLNKYFGKLLHITCGGEELSVRIIGVRKDNNNSQYITELKFWQFENGGHKLKILRVEDHFSIEGEPVFVKTVFN